MTVTDEAGPRTGGPGLRALADGLLPPPPAPPASRGRTAAGYLLAFAAALAFLLLTPAGWARLDHLWAEDGARFMVDAVTLPAFSNLVDPYGGYLHALPRLVAELVALLPLEWTAAGFAVSAAVLRAVVALISFAASGAYLRSLPLRVALAALVVVLPAGNSEPLNNMANLHWFLLYGVFWALLWRNAPRVPVTLFVFLAAVSSPLVLVLLPIALLRLALPRKELPVAFLAGALAQGVTMLFAERLAYSHDAVDPVQVALATLLRVPVVAFTGSEQVARFYPEHGNLPILAALVLAAAPVVAGLRWGDRAGRLLVLLGVGLGALVMVVSLTANWSAVLQAQQPTVVMAGQRYSVAPCLFLFAAIAVGLDAVPARRWERLAVVAGRSVIGLVVLASVLLHLRSDRVVLNGVPWDESVARARVQCVEGGPVGRLEHEPTDWFFEVPCRYVVDGARTRP
ncbi:hypothetical protein ADK67_29445 [Saccharothrix sp. NRRL B-16348]|uniref:hypothetical protein n=1 Tax=Saccharothrix sp. NRRL B-16348 TaxID=1415542 RepID=UPI0006B01E3D|nr:hypothetical protein [Saccharothrix sp. NRRL B-16348]KOX20445.1 hypothetical protein ADK67_29445 [Saccharothrix sp. NRRL B-16348]